MGSHSQFLRLKEICYLDHAGATLYSEHQIQNIMQDFCSNVYANPHSQSIASRHTADVVDQIRYRVLQHFNTDLEEYDVVFTSGATSALKLVAESFHFGNGDNSQENAGYFVYAQENHTSVLGMREVVADRCSRVVGAPLEQLKKSFSDFTLSQQEGEESPTIPNSLLVFSAQCNFSGLKTPLSWVEGCHKGALQNYGGMEIPKSNWFCLLDAASLVATSPLDLSVHKPDFVVLSFYKMFGYPTGLGALLVRNSSAHTLSQRRYFGGGTVLMARSAAREHILRPVLHDRFEDGTIPFLSIVAIRHGFDILTQLMGSISRVQKHTFQLARRAHHSLMSLQHGNGAPVAHLYCDTDFEDSDTQGAILNFNLLRPNGEYIGYMEVLNLANSNKIQLRTGCFCNPGACQRHLNLTDDDLSSHLEAGHVCGDDRDLINGTPTGSVRISFGYMSNEAEVDTFLKMIYSCFVVSEPYQSHSPELGEEDKWFDAIGKEDSAAFNDHIPSNRIPSHIDNGIQDLKVNTETVQIMKNRAINSVQADFDRGGARLSQVCLFPVKSCGAFHPLMAWAIGPRGLAYDRLWMVVTAAGTALTQTQEPHLACVRPVIDLKNRMLHLSFSGQMKTVSVPLDEQRIQSDVNETVFRSLCQSKVCGDRVKGQDCGEEAAQWLSEVLQRSGLRLVRQLNEDRRNASGNNKAIGLSNKAQFLLVSETSVSWLGKQIPGDEFNKEGLLDRFRANLVIQHLPTPFEEVNWKEIYIGNQRFKVDGPCTRCGVVCVDQATGERTNEPLRTLSAALHSKVRFGIYLSHQPGNDDDGMVAISRGDPVRVIAEDVTASLISGQI